MSEDLVGNIYIESWKQGLKGITVYRDGSRSGILVSDDKKKEKTDNKINAFLGKRPKILEAAVVRFFNDTEKWLAVIGLMDNKPYEIFTGRMQDAFDLPDYVDKGWVVKERNEEGIARYDFQYKDKDGYLITIQGLSRSFDKEYWNYAKLISGVLRHGMPLHYVVDLVNNLNLFDENINTWKNGVARTLKRFIPDGTEAVDKRCPECGDPEGLIYMEGCLTCKSCGHSKCG